MVQADNGLIWFAWCHETRHALNAKICQDDNFGILRTWCVNLSSWQFWYCGRHSIVGRQGCRGGLQPTDAREQYAYPQRDSCNWAYGAVHVTFIGECLCGHCQGQWADNNTCALPVRGHKLAMCISWWIAANDFSSSCDGVCFKHAPQQVSWLCVDTELNKHFYEIRFEVHLNCGKLV